MNKNILKDPLVYSVCIIAAVISSFMSMLFRIKFNLDAISVIFYYLVPCLCMIAAAYLHFFSDKKTMITYYVAAIFMALQYSNIIGTIIPIFTPVGFDFVAFLSCSVYFLLFLFDFYLFVMVYNNKKYLKIFYIIKFIILLILTLNLIRVSDWGNIFFVVFHIILFLMVYKAQNPDEDISNKGNDIVKEEVASKEPEIIEKEPDIIAKDSEVTEQE